MYEEAVTQKQNWTKQEWDQLKGISKAKLIQLLRKDPDWEETPAARGSRIVFCNKNLPLEDQYVAIHKHAGGYHDKGLLKNLLAQIGWSAQRLRKWKVIR